MAFKNYIVYTHISLCVFFKYILYMKKWKWKSFSSIQLFVTPWNSPGQNTGVGSLSLFQGIFPTQGSNSGLPHYRQILYQLSHRGSPWYIWGGSKNSFGMENPNEHFGQPNIVWLNFFKPRIFKNIFKTFPRVFRKMLASIWQFIGLYLILLLFTKILIPCTFIPWH